MLKKINRPLKIFSLFSGMGAFEEALSELEIPFQLMGFSEIDEKIADVYSLIHDVPHLLNYGDITKIDEKDLP